MSRGGATKTILCIEDEHRLRQDILDELAEAGYGALGASDGREALALLNRRRPDLILCDISMPHLDGYGFLEAVRTTRPDLADVPLVFLTALAGREHVINGKRAGADDYLVKPVDFDLMLTTIEARLAQVERMNCRIEGVASLRKVLATSSYGSKATGLESVLDMLAFGIVLMSASGVVFANRVARKIHAANDGLSISGTVHAASSSLNTHLRALIDATFAMARKGEDHLASLPVPRLLGGHDYLLTICALPHVSEDDTNAPQAVIFISDPSRRPEMPNDVLSGLFGLTPTEAEVARALAHGRRTDEIASDLSISATTVAFHLRNLFEKTGTNRQVDLIALILAGLASIAGPQANETGNSP